jgi:enoyl-CoA hydratase
MVSYHFDGTIATITIDDGKVNVLSLAVLTELNTALNQAEQDDAVVVIEGRDGVFSAGFDLPVLRNGGPDALAMLRAGFELAARLLTFPGPVVIACTGHAVAMGVFLLLCGDYRVGATGPFKITANEVAIGVTMPRAAVEICRQRLTPAYFHRAVVLAETFSPADAVAAGFLDRTVEASEVREVARAIAAQLATLDRPAHAATKERASQRALTVIRSAIDADFAAYPVQAPAS